MKPHIKPCPMCGDQKNKLEKMQKEREQKERELKSFLIGRRSVDKFSRRENEIFDSHFDLGLSFKEIARNEGIDYHSVVKFYDRAIDKLFVMDFEI